MGNIDAARRLIEDVRAAGASDFCVCAGSRNSPLLAVIGASPDLRVFSFIDERSAAFFAIGRAKLHGRPVVVVTTSGTAAAELLPAAVEAHYAGIPLILVTADRPARFRGTGAPQSIEQIGLFGVYAATSFEEWDGIGALHLNVEFDEPLIDGEVRGVDAESDAAGAGAPAPWGADVLVRSAHPRADETSAPHKNVAAGDSAKEKRPLVIIGALTPRHHQRVRDFVLQLGAPVYAEPLSGLREDATLPLITAGERMIPRGGFDSVIRIGNVPTLRFWRDLETLDLPVVHYSDLPFTGVTRGEVHPIEELPHGQRVDRDDAFFAEDARRAAAFAAILDDEPRSELAMFRALSEELPQNARVYLGNSLPIREWDLAASRQPRGFTYEANRGANGIDGQLSTFFGQCNRERDNVCVLGDLTTIYDLGAPWIVPQLDAGTRFRIVVVNNGGGRIFSRVASLRVMEPAARERLIENVHTIRFGDWARMWNIADRVTELVPDEEASRRAWRRYDALWA